jgi:hypothetical protein
MRQVCTPPCRSRCRRLGAAVCWGVVCVVVGLVTVGFVFRWCCRCRTRMLWELHLCLCVVCGGPWWRRRAILDSGPGAVSQRVLAVAGGRSLRCIVVRRWVCTSAFRGVCVASRNVSRLPANHSPFFVSTPRRDHPSVPCAAYASSCCALRRRVITLAYTQAATHKCNHGGCILVWLCQAQLRLGDHLPVHTEIPFHTCCTSGLFV